MKKLGREQGPGSVLLQLVANETQVLGSNPGQANYYFILCHQYVYLYKRNWDITLVIPLKRRSECGFRSISNAVIHWSFDDFY